MLMLLIITLTRIHQVTEEDANDVVNLLQESILDSLTTESGVIEIGRKGGMSLAKQVNYVPVARIYS